jgi:hypothetical protein
MSYDLFVFEPQDDLRERKAFLAWYETQTNWWPGIDYCNPKNASPALRAWYLDMIGTFPPINGPDRPPIDEIEQRLTADYCVGAMFIYVAFAGLNSQNAYEKVVSLAARHGLGFFDASGNSKVWFPKSTGELAILHERQEGDPPGRLARQIAQAIERGEAVQVKGVEEFVQKILGMGKDPRA